MFQHVIPPVPHTPIVGLMKAVHPIVDVTIRNPPGVLDLSMKSCRSAINQPSVNQPTVNRQTANQSSVNQLTVNQVTVNQPTISRQAANQPAIDRPAVNRQTANKPTVRYSLNSLPVLSRDSLVQMNRNAVQDDDLPKQSTPSPTHPVAHKFLNPTHAAKKILNNQHKGKVMTIIKCKASNLSSAEIDMIKVLNAFAGSKGQLHLLEKKASVEQTKTAEPSTSTSKIVDYFGAKRMEEQQEVLETEEIETEDDVEIVKEVQQKSTDTLSSETSSQEEVASEDYRNGYETDCDALSLFGDNELVDFD